MDKKAQGLSLNTIIIAIIVLIVLVVMIMVFTGYFGTKFTPAVTSCSNAGGECKFECGFDAFGNPVANINAECSGSQVCCSKGLGSGEAKSEDSVDCGQEGKAACSSGQACQSGLVQSMGKCVKLGSSSSGSSAATSGSSGNSGSSASGSSSGSSGSSGSSSGGSSGSSGGSNPFGGASGTAPANAPVVPAHP